ncbi:serine hydrolase [Sporosarcina sp. Te-1]|uniref:serine hydrolase n=1 Tax=Sporosarcina sp. Te-1 TaxID=2818390 RepID=UPI001A9FF10D|nr:serine hydrolase [Sporosarcina sp. Te-1]QTD42948.1 serine hydrolase [Sporosarcina sp. Te-1]
MRKLLFIMVIGFLLMPTNTFAKEKVLPSGMPVEDVEQTVDAIMEKYIGKDIPGVAIAIVQDGEVILLKGYGQSDIEKNIPVDPAKTIFEAASVSKVYTWSAVMQLVEQGKIDLDADIREYLPNDFLKLDFDEKVTMLHLMNHTAGFEEKTEYLFTYDPKDIISLDDYMMNEKQPKQVHKPGAITSYSNYSTALAGYIVQRVSGQPFEEYMQDQVLGKLQMDNSSFKQNWEQMKTTIASKGFGYEKNGDHFETAPNIYVSESPAGSLNTTASDMAKFMLAHLNQQQTGEFQLFQDNETLRTIHDQSYSPNPQMPGNAHGFWERLNGEYRMIEHGGNLLGYTALLSLLPEQNFGLAFLTNVANESSNLRIDLYNALVGDEKKTISVTRSEHDQMVQGTYRVARGVYSNFLSFVPVLGNDSDFKIKKHEKGGINVQTPFKEEFHYVETAPFFYERVGDDLSLMDKLGLDMSRMAFVMDDKQNVSKMSFGVISDNIPVKIMDRVSTNMVLLSICLVTFILYTLFFVIRLIRRLFKSKNGKASPSSTSYRFTAILAGIGILVFVNLVILFSRFIPDPVQSLAPLKIHIGINWLFPIATLVCGYFILKNLKQTSLAGRIFQILLILVSILFCIFLYHFHFLY